MISDAIGGGRSKRLVWDVVKKSTRYDKDEGPNGKERKEMSCVKKSRTGR